MQKAFFLWENDCSQAGSPSSGRASTSTGACTPTLRRLRRKTRKTSLARNKKIVRTFSRTAFRKACHCPSRFRRRFHPRLQQAKHLHHRHIRADQDPCPGEKRLLLLFLRRRQRDHRPGEGGRPEGVGHLLQRGPRAQGMVRNLLGAWGQGMRREQGAKGGAKG